MKLSALGENGEGHKHKFISLSFLPKPKTKILNLLPREHGMVQKTMSRYCPFVAVVGEYKRTKYIVTGTYMGT
jgi:hypothetical protein